MKVINKSDWKTEPLLAICKAVAKGYGRHSLRGVVLEIRSTKQLNSSFRIGVLYLPDRETAAKHALTGGTITLSPKDIVSAINTRYGGMPYFNPVIPQIQLELKRYRAPKSKPKTGTNEYKLWYAKSMLKRASRKLKLANTIYRKWERRVKRLEKKCL